MKSKNYGNMKGGGGGGQQREENYLKFKKEVLWFALSKKFHLFFFFLSCFIGDH